LLVAACFVPSSPIFVTLMKEAPGSSETSVLTRATQRNISEDTILHSHRRENLKSYIPGFYCRIKPMVLLYELFVDIILFIPVYVFLALLLTSSVDFFYTSKI
jgi:hypothetical protein